MGGQAQALRLGPFTGGLNSASDPTAVADSELVECKNLELDIDGSLVCRPPIVETVNNSGSWTKRIVIIGRAIIAGGTYVIGSNSDGTYAFDGTTWSVVKAGLESRCAIQFQDLLFVVATPASAQPGGFWDGTTFTNDTNMPRGAAAAFHKSRMFVVPGIDQTGAAAHQLRFTDPISVATPTPLVWTGTNLIPISQGDGEKLVDLVVYNDNIMLFKQDSTYVLAYDLSPSDAILRKVNNDIGATTHKCIVSYENSIFCYHEGNVYEIVNYDFQRINVKVPFLFDGGAPSTRAENVFICLLGDRLIVRYYNRVYVFGLKTRTWSRWESAAISLHNFGPLLPFPSNPTQFVNTKYVGGSSIQATEEVYMIFDGFDAVTVEKTTTGGTVLYDIECVAQTKNYDLADSHHYKKLMWWGADVISNRNITGIATPIIANFQVVWSDLTVYKWVDLTMNTWEQPKSTTASVPTVADDLLSIGRKFVKFLKALRWRQINFTVKLLCNGSTAQGPCRLFTMTVIVSTKQTAVKQVN
jgi:hypothetical protein